MIRKLISGVLAVAMILSLAACAESEDSKNSSSQTEVTTTEEAITAVATVTTTEEITEQTTTEKATTTTEATTAAAVTGNKFTSTLGYTLTMPEGWEKAEWPAGLEGCMDENGNNFTALSAAYNKSFENMNKSYFTDFFKNFPKMELKEYQKIEISGCTGHRIDVRNNYSANVSILQTQIYFAVNKKVLLFTFTDAEGSNQQKIEDMISSISFN